ncbi:MAG TPA: RnfABCDGE type electron transport complex subunit A [Firmicutes bacterium]|nr:RnfABCDGE type electron transport complex subunit A [Bacillota bacterium]
MNILGIIVSAIIVDNFVFSRVMGICPFMGVSNKVKTAVGMGAAVTFVMALASVITNVLYNYVLLYFNVTYLRTLVFILVIASLVQLVEMIIKRVSVTLYEALGVYLPLITTNCAVLGAAILNIDNGYDIIESLALGIGAALGFTLALVLMAAIRERQETVNLPRAMRGKPIALMMAGLMSLAFLGFSGMMN